MSTRGAQAFLLVFVAVASARAQAPTGTIAGTATDASGAPAAGVPVGIANRDTGQARTAITSTEGRYGAEALLPGVYRVRIRRSALALSGGLQRGRVQPAPFSAYVNGVDFNGDGTVNDLLPGTTINQFGRGLDRDDLVRLVAAYNSQYAGKVTLGGQLAPPLKLPDNYSFNDAFFTQDLRLTRTFPIGGDRVRLLLFAEVFNLLNTANLVSTAATSPTRRRLVSPAGASARSSAPAAPAPCSSARASISRSHGRL